MVTSALVLTLTPQPVERLRALAHLASDPRLELGEPVFDRLPVVVESTTAAEGAELCEALGAHEGVLRVDVVAIDFGEDA